MAKRQYKEEFINYGFTYITDRGTTKPQCVICGDVLSNESLKQNKLQRHFESKHKEYAEKPKSFFERKENELKKQRLDAPSNKAAYSLEKATLASYLVAWRIAQNKKPHTIGETLVKPAAIEMVRTLCGNDVAKKIEQVPLSNDTVHTRITDMSNDIKEQLIEAIKLGGKFSLQLDESTDVSDDAQLLAYVRYEDPTEIKEDFLFCCPFVTRTTGSDIYNLVNTFFEKEGLDWNDCYSICTDGAPAMRGCRQGFVAKAKQQNPDIITVHCLLHRENLAARKLSKELGDVMIDVIAVVNFIKAHSLNCRLFAQLCTEFDSDHIHLLYYSEVRWLSRGKVLQRVAELRKEMEDFLLRKGHRLASKFSDVKWLLQLAFLADIFAELNILNTNMQGRNKTLVHLSEQVMAFKGKLRLWKNKIANQRLASFPVLNLFVEENENAEVVFREIQDVFCNYLTALMGEFDSYIPDNTLDYKWVLNPFDVIVEEMAEEFGNIVNLQEELIEVQNDSTFQQLYKKEPLCQFWTAIKKEKPILGNEAFKVLLPFVTSYLCEAGFSSLTVMKTKYRNRLHPEHDMRCALSKIKPRFDKLSSVKQAQGSH